MTVLDLDRVITGLRHDELGSGSISDILASSGQACTYVALVLSSNYRRCLYLI